MLNDAGPGLLLAAYLFGAAIFAVVERRHLARLLGSVGRPAAYFFIVSICLLLISQTYLPGGTLYPYASWTMYTSPSPDRATWLVEFVRESGARERIPIARIMPGPNPRAAMRHVTAAAWRLDRAAEDDREARRAELDRLLDALARLDVRHSPEDPVRRIEVRRCTIEGGTPWSRGSFRCEPFVARGVDAGGDGHAP